MLFLLEVEVESMPAGLEVPDFLERVIKEWEYFGRLKSKGKILAGGKLAGRRGAAAILEASSHEEADGIVAKLPLFPFFTRIELTPLVTPDEALEEATRMCKFLRVAQQQKNKDKSE